MGGPRRRAAVAIGVLIVAIAAGCAAPRHASRALTRERVPERGRVELAAPALPTTTLPVPPPPPATVPPPPPPPPSTTAPPAPAPLQGTVGRARLPASVDAYRGLGTWVDVYDWSATFAGPRGGPFVGPADVDRMADAGVQTVYIQTSKADAPTDVLEPERLLPLIRRAHERRLRVVAWYLPTLVDPAADLRRLLAAARLGVDGLAVDIEARDVTDVGERNQRLVALSQALRRALPGQAIGAIVLPPVVTDVINRGYWPAFPWRALVPSYDVWLPMAYWTNRTASSGWRDGYRYTIENVTRLRQHLGVPGAPVHLIGGIGDAVTPGDLDGMLRGVGEHGCLGASLYDWRTTAAGDWPVLARLRWRP